MGFREEGISVGDMLVTKAVRYQPFDRLIEQFVAPIPEQLFSLRIDQSNQTIGANNDQGIGQRLQQSAIGVFGPAAGCVMLNALLR